MTSDRDIALLIWRAASMAERDPVVAAQFLELAALRLRRKANERIPAPAGIAGNSQTTRG
jgi:hypothetical protein